MTALTRITCHAVHKMTPQAREGLARELYAVHEQIFGGLSFEDFREYVVERPAWRTWIYVKRDPSGVLVGYHSMHAFQLEAGGRGMTVVRMEAGTLPTHRGRDLTMAHAVGRLLLVWASQPWRRFCIFAALTHPSSYTFLSHYAPIIYPHLGREIPPKVMALMEELAEAFQLPRVDPANTMVRQVDWVTLESPEERARWLYSRRRDTRYYMKNNPGYMRGHGLLTYIPFNGLILVWSLVRFMKGRAGRLARLVLGEQVVGADPALTNAAPLAPTPLPRPSQPGREFAHTRPPSL
jgi:hypothetical protein